MHVRSPGIPDEPIPARNDSPAGTPAGDTNDGTVGDTAGDTVDDSVGDTTGDPAGGDPTVVSFRVPAGVIVAKFAIAATLAGASLLAQNSSQLMVGALAVGAVLVYAARDVVARERLRADPAGIVAVHGYARRRRLAWAQLEAVRVDSRPRLGARTELLELDAGTEIFLYSRFDLGLEPDDALAALSQVNGGQVKGRE